MSDDDYLVFDDEPDVAGDSIPSESAGPWKVVIVDDEEFVHKSTKLSLNHLQLDSRPLELLSAYSANDAKRLLRENADVAVILLDVVMEEDDAGLALVDWIRNELDNPIIRIILRTGQPGYAPEMEVINRYEINDYLAKGQLTVERFWTSVTTALRSYQQVCALEQSRRGLRQVIASSSDLMRAYGLESFGQGVLQQIAAHLQLQTDGLFAVAEEHDEQPNVVAATGQYAGAALKPLENNPFVPGTIVEAVKCCLREKEHVFDADGVVLFLHASKDWAAAVRIDGKARLDANELDLLELFCSNIALGFDNTKLFDKVSKLAFIDSLTQLPNTTSLLERLGEQNPPAGFLLMLDVDFFHELNETLGYDKGNQVLQEFSLKIRNIVPESCTVARLHTDVFAVYSTDQSKACIVPMLEELAKPIFIGGEEYRFGITSGLAEYHPGLSPHDVLRQSEIALKKAKGSKRGRLVEFSIELEEAITNRGRLVHDLRGAFNRDELRLAYQPKINLATRELEGFEALLRWQHTSRGWVSPGEFIPVTEHSGLIIDFGEWIIDEACKALVKFQKSLANLHLAINVSPVQLRESTFPKKMLAIVERNGISPTSVIAEVTEGIAADEERAIFALDTLRDKKFSVSLDDFGTGYSSMSYLMQLPINSIKIDRAFVREIPGTEATVKILESIIKIAGALNLDVVVEGLETDRQVKIVSDLGATTGQGYYFAKPMFLDEALEFIAAYRPL